MTSVVPSTEVGVLMASLPLAAAASAPGIGSPQVSTTRIGTTRSLVSRSSPRSAPVCRSTPGKLSLQRSSPSADVMEREAVESASHQQAKLNLPLVSAVATSLGKGALVADDRCVYGRATCWDAASIDHSTGHESAADQCNLEVPSRGINELPPFPFA